MIAGSLEIQLMANVARLQADMDAAKRAVSDAMAGMERAIGFAKVALVALAGVASVGAFVGMIRESIAAADKLKDLAAQTGATVEALSALKSVGKLSDTSLESIANAMGKMSKNLAVASEESKGTSTALKALGINVEAFKLLRPDEQMMALAKAQAIFADGGGKSAAMMAIMGKEGAKLIPLLKDMATIGELNAKVTADQAEMADNLNDNLVRIKGSGEAWKKSVAMGILPVLSDLSDAWLKAMNGSGGLRDTIKKLSDDGTLENWARNSVVAMTYLLDVGQGLISLFPLISTAMESAAAGVSTWFAAMYSAFTALKKGDIGGAFDALKTGAEDVGRIASKAAVDVSSIWNQQLIGEKIRSTMIEAQILRMTTSKAAEEAKNQVNFDDSKSKAAKEAIDKEAQAYAKLTANIAEHIAIATASGQQTESLTSSEKLLIKVEADLANGTLKLSKEHEAGAIALLKVAIGIEKTKAAMAESNQQMNLALAAEATHLDSITKQNESLQEQLITIGMSTDQLALYKKAKLDAAAAADFLTAANLEEAAQEMESDPLLAKQIEYYRQLAAAKRESAAALRDQGNLTVAVDAAKAASEEWKRTAETIERTLTDALMRGFESGKGFGENMRDAIVNMFKTMVLRPVIQGVVQGGLSAIGLGGGTAATASGGLGGIANLASMGSSAYSLATGNSIFGSLTSGLSSGFLSGASETALGASFVGPSASLANGSIGVGAQAGSMFGGVPFMGPAAVLAGMLLSGSFYNQGYRWDAGRNTAIDPGFTFNTRIGESLGLSGHTMAMITGSSLIQRLLGKAGGPKDEGDAFATIMDPAGALRTESTATGGDGNWYTGSSADAQMAELIKPIGTTIADYIKSLGGNATGLGINLGYNHDGQGDAPDNISAGLSDASGKYIYRQTYDTSRDGAPAALAIELKRMSLAAIEAASGVDQAYVDVVKSMILTTATTEELDAAIVQLSKISQVKDAFENLGLGADAVTTGLINAAGGIDALATMSSSYYDNFYTEAEKHDKTLASVTEAFTGLGMTLPTTREAFRSIVEGLDLTTASGQSTFVSLMNVQGAFISVTGAADTASAAVANLALSSMSGYEAFVAKYYNSTEQQAMHGAHLAETFGKLNIAMPTTLAGFRGLVEGLDLTTEDGQKTAQALLNASGEFYDYINGIGATGDAAAGAANQIQQAVESINSISVGVGEIFEQGISEANAFQSSLAGLTTGMSFKDSLALQIGEITKQLQYFTIRPGVVGDGYGGATLGGHNYMPGELDSIRDQFARILATMSGDMAEFVTYSAQYSSGVAEQLVALNNWKEQQAGMMIGNATLLALLDESYKRQFDAIIKGGGTAGAASGTSALSSLLHQTLGTMQAAILPELHRNQAKAEIEGALAIAKASGVLPKAEDLRDALSAASKLDQGSFATAADYQREYLRTMGTISELSALTDGQLSVEEQTLAATNNVVAAVNNVAAILQPTRLPPIEIGELVAEIKGLQESQRKSDDAVQQLLARIAVDQRVVRQIAEKSDAIGPAPARAEA